MNPQAGRLYRSRRELNLSGGRYPAGRLAVWAGMQNNARGNSCYLFQDVETGSCYWQGGPIRIGPINLESCFEEVE